MTNPAFIEHFNEIARKLRERAPRWRAIERDIWDYIEKQAGVEFSETELGIGASLDIDNIRFDFFCETDEELEKDRVSGRQDQLTRIMEGAARKFADAKSSVHFHSHQTVREKCGGSYYRYFR
jgi:hypothetical protein